MIDLKPFFLRLYNKFPVGEETMALPAFKKSSSRPSGSQPPDSRLAILQKIPGGKFFWVFLLLIAVGMGSWLVFGDKGLYHLYTLRQEKERLLQANLILKDENERLVKIIERLQGDQEFIEDTIRKDLNFIKRNEVIYQLEPEVGSATRVTQAPALGPPPSPTAKAKSSGRQ